MGIFHWAFTRPPDEKAVWPLKDMEERARRRAKVPKMDGLEKSAREHAGKRLAARERIQTLLDPDSLCEMGMLNCFDMPEMKCRTTAERKMAGFGGEENP